MDFLTKRAVKIGLGNMRTKVSQNKNKAEFSYMLQTVREKSPRYGPKNFT